MTGHVIHEHVTINASPSNVWQVVTDLPRLADVLRSVRTVRLLTEGEYAVGTRWEESRTFFGHRGSEELTVTECLEPIRTTWETTLRHDRITTVWALREANDGTTKLMVTATLDISQRRAFERFAWDAWGGLQFEATRHMLQRDLQDLKQEAETRGGRHSTSAA